MKIDKVESGGRYISRFAFADDQIRFPLGFSLNSIFSKSLVIHECTHAHIDNQGIGDHSFYEEEAVCYLAQYIYLRTVDKHYKIPKDVPRNDGRFLFYEVAADYIVKSKSKGYFYVVPPTTAQKLKMAVGRIAKGFAGKDKIVESDGT